MASLSETKAISVVIHSATVGSGPICNGTSAPKLARFQLTATRLTSISCLLKKNQKRPLLKSVMHKQMSSCKTAWRWLTKKDDRRLAYIEAFPITISKCGANSPRQAKDSALVSQFMTQRFGPRVCSLKH